MLYEQFSCFLSSNRIISTECSREWTQAIGTFVPLNQQSTHIFQESCHLFQATADRSNATRYANRKKGKGTTSSRLLRFQLPCKITNFRSAREASRSMRKLQPGSPRQLSKRCSVGENRPPAPVLLLWLSSWAADDRYSLHQYGHSAKVDKFRCFTPS